MHPGDPRRDYLAARRVLDYVPYVSCSPGGGRARGLFWRQEPGEPLERRRLCTGPAPLWSLLGRPALRMERPSSRVPAWGQAEWDGPAFARETDSLPDGHGSTPSLNWTRGPWSPSVNSEPSNGGASSGSGGWKTMEQEFAVASGRFVHQTPVACLYPEGATGEGHVPDASIH